MSYQCPRCQNPVQRNSSKGAQIAGGLIGALLVAAFGDFQCARCGKIPAQEFPTEVRVKMRQNSALMIFGAIALAIFVIWLISLK